MKKRRKTDKCLNCGYELDPSFDYCPKCGQENTDNQISFGGLINEFFSNYFSLDSRFGRSVIPFFLKPGKLTAEFMDGKRVMYANPIRLYLLVSLIHFFIMNTYLDMSAEHGRIFNPKEEQIQQFDSLETKLKTDTVFQKDIKPLTDLIKSEAIDSITSKEDTSSWTTQFSEDISTIMKMSNKRYSVQEIEDSIHNESKTFFAQKVNRQFIKIMTSDKHAINMFIVKNIPILLFFLLPLYALILKIFFRKKLYINHVVHGLHIHSFMFIVLTIYWIIKIFSESAAEFIDFYFFLLISAYIVLSFKNTYHIKIGKAIWKTLGTGFFYWITLGFGMFLEVIISLFFF
ncbi:MAG: hypothetical protein CMB80_26330 [Flammeovirgaceae bacterium]|nr:hypothetical protein [Flammeovirgaceae bacterium]|tara:strand:- start:550 stop:1584 length:1035 start_codon:yes stop_codon:yes gene_type:complete